MNSLIREIDLLAGREVPVSQVEIGGQHYALASNVEAPSPPWGETVQTILIAIPAAEGAALDGFYLRLPYTFNGGKHNRVNGGVISFDNAQWQLVSWHYPDGHPWRSGQDNLESHIAHCKGFFWQRGAVNAPN